MAMKDKYLVFGDVLKLMVMSGIQYHDKFEVMKVRYQPILIRYEISKSSEC
jgi:hypothetical protein